MEHKVGNRYVTDNLRFTVKVLYSDNGVVFGTVSPNGSDEIIGTGTWNESGEPLIMSLTNNAYPGEKDGLHLEWEVVKTLKEAMGETTDADSEQVNEALYGDNHFTKVDILNEAIKVVGGRGKSYGRPEDNFQRIATLWTAHFANRYGLDLEVDVQDVAMMMALMKIARLQNDPNHHDSWVDTAGYAACGGELASIANGREDF